MKKRYIIIEDLNTFDCYSVLSKKEYDELGLNDKILFKGSIDVCNEWIDLNPHPKSIDYSVIFDEENEDIDLRNLFI